MHDWNSDWPHFQDVERVASEIGDFLRKWGRIGVRQTKEKYGTVRVYTSLGWDSLYSITHPGYMYYRYPRWLMRLDIYHISKLINILNPLVYPCHKWLYRLAYKRAIAKYPHIIIEILIAADYDELLLDLWPKDDPRSNYIEEI